MSFASLDFALFALAFFPLYALIGQRFPVLFIAGASLFFYGWWDIRYLPLIVLSALVDYTCSLRIHATEHAPARRRWMLASVGLNLGILIYFKYWNFFSKELSRISGEEHFIHELILPIGLSFYTLQTLGYTLDVYKRKITPERNFLTYMLFVSFFPQLVAGPIERARKLLPQLNAIPAFDFALFRAGLLIVLWGLFIKVAVADNLSEFVSRAFGMSEPGYLLWIICLAAMFQVYCDFYGYTLMARGLGRAMGISLSENFRQPFFAKTPTEFWQRWHISLTRWITDYVYIPLVKRRPTEPFRSLSTIFMLCLIGLWHGASWNFILFGLFHGIVLRVWVLSENRLPRLITASWLVSGAKRLALMICLALSAPLFFVIDMEQLSRVLSALFKPYAALEDIMYLKGNTQFLIGVVLALIVIVNDVLIRRNSRFNVEAIANTSRLSIIYVLGLTALIVLFSSPEEKSFVYFQF